MRQKVPRPQNEEPSLNCCHVDDTDVVGLSFFLETVYDAY